MTISLAAGNFAYENKLAYEASRDGPRGGADLQLAFMLIALAVDLVHVFVGELALFFLDLAFGLLPVTFDSVPIHSHFLANVFVYPDDNRTA